MENLPSMMSPDFGLLFWMLLAFLVVLVLMVKYGFPVIIKMVDKRKEYIDESLRAAREANEKLSGIKQESESILRKAREEQAQILKEAMATRDSIVKQARAEAQAEGQKLIAEAKAQIEAERESALGDIRATVVDLSVLIAQKIVQRELEKSQEQEALISRTLDELEHK